MSNKTELSLEPVGGELLPTGKMPTLTPAQVNVLAVIQSVSKVEVLANIKETVAGIERMKASYLPIVELAKTEIANVKTKADLERAKEPRLAIREERLGFTNVVDAELAARKLIYDSAKKGKVKVEDAFKLLEEELGAVEKPVDERLKAAAAAKKALTDAVANLKAHTINPLLSVAKIEIAIDDFRFLFGDADYQESQSVAESIFESKITEFDSVLAAAVEREENVRKIRAQEEQALQRANINVKFPLTELSGFSGLSSAYIQVRIDLLKEVDMSAFDLVLSEAEIAKNSCLNMLNAFLPMAVAREAKEAADKVEAERVESEKQAEIDAKAAYEAAEKQYQSDWDLAIIDDTERDNELAQELNELTDSFVTGDNVDSKHFVESAVIAIINDDAVVAEDIAKIIGEPCFEQSNPELSEPALNGGNGEPSQDDYESWEAGQDLEVVEVFETKPSEPTVNIPVRHLQALFYAAKQAAKHCDLDDDDTIAAIEFAESLI